MLTPAGRLTPTAWMVAPPTRAVIAALSAEGATVRFVGGCVRDALLERETNDIDIATPDPPDRVRRLLQAAGLKAVPTGLAHGTITAVAEGMPFQVTTLRTDVETFGRHARVAFTDDWVVDAARRDFTFNALFSDPDGIYYDPFDGAADLHSGRVRFVGDARERIMEDYLRLLRFFRFFAHFGQPPPDPEALAACAALAPKLDSLSGERIRDETLKLLAAPAPESALQLLTDAGVWPHFLPEALPAAADDFAGLRALVAIERRLDAVDPLRRLALLVGGGTNDAMPLAGRLKLSNPQRDRLQLLLRPSVNLAPDAPVAAHRAALYRCGPEAYRDLLLRSWALAEREWSDGLDDLWALPDRWPVPKFPIAGRDVVALGVPAGPKVGKLVAATEAWWIEQDFAPDRAALLGWLRERVKD